MGEQKLETQACHAEGFEGGFPRSVGKVQLLIDRPTGECNWHPLLAHLFFGRNILSNGRQSCHNGAPRSLERKRRCFSSTPAAPEDTTALCRMLMSWLGEAWCGDQKTAHETTK